MMMKNFLTFFGCLLWLDCAFSAPIVINPGDGQGAEFPGGLVVPSDNYAAVQTGIGLAVGAPGISVVSLFVGTNATPSATPAGQLYVEEATAQNYSIRSDGDISITDLLEVSAGRSVGFAGKTSTIGEFFVGQINAFGAMTVSDVNTFKSKSITSYDVLTLSANNINIDGAVNSEAGNTTISATEEFNVIGDFVSKGNATTQINVGSMSAANLQNMTGTMAIVSDGTITTTGSFENSGTLLSVKGTTDENAGPQLVVNGTMKNDSTNGSMNLKLGSLTVTGGSGNDASFVNAGDLVMIVAGETNLANGFDLSTMGATNVFNLTTGTLVLGGVTDAMSRLFENDKLTNYKLVVNNGGIVADNITNGVSNSSARMSITATEVVANSIQNYGEQMDVSSTNNGDIEIGATPQGTSIYGASGTQTNVTASGTLSATGAVTNAGTMDLYGNVVELVGVSNSGTLTIMGPTDTTGKIKLSGGISNSGTATISARQISIDGTVANTAGKTTITGSDTSGDNMVIGAVDVTGGMLELDAKGGGIDITNSFAATNTGAINIGGNVTNLNVGGTTTIGGDLTFFDTPVTGGGNVNVAHSGDTGFVLSSTGIIDIFGDVVATENTGTRSASLVSNNITVGGNVNVANANTVTFGDANSSTSSLLSITGDVAAENGGAVEIYSKTAMLKSLSGSGKYIMHGKTVSATGGTINVSNGIWYDGTTNLDKGMIISDTSELTLQTTAQNQGIDISGGVSIANGKLNIASAADANISGNVVVDGTNGGALDVKATANDVVFDTGTITTKNGGSVTAAGKTITTSAITNGANNTNGSVTLGGTSTQSITVNGAVSNNGSFAATAGTIETGAFTSTGGAVNIAATGGTLKMGATDVSAGSAILSGTKIALDSLKQEATGLIKLSSGMVSATGDIVIANGDISQNGTTAALVLNGVNKLTANNLTALNGALVVSSGDTLYEITNNASFSNGITVDSGAATINALSITGGPIVNSDELTLNAKSDFSFDTITNTGTLVLNTTGDLGAKSITNNSGTINITANNTILTNAMTVGGMLYQDYFGTLNSGDVNITPKNHNLNAASLTASGIIQSDVSTMSITTNSTIINGAVNANVLTINSPLVQITGALDAKDMKINSANVTIGGGITAGDLRIAATDSTNWLTVNVTGNVSGNVDIVGLKNMNITGNYTYNNNSMLHAAILANPATNYWSTVSLADDNTLGRITNAATNAAPLISVGGQFIYDVSNVGPELFDDNLVNPQIGIDIFDMIDPGTAIWLLHSNSDKGLKEVADKIRNLNVNFCNADGTRCFKYFNNSVLGGPGIEENLPAYLSVRDINEDGITDSIYIVFDPRFGGPVNMFKIQPIVARVGDHTDGEYDTAGGLDDMLEGQLHNVGFYNRTPIEAIPVAFRGTNLEKFAQELYERMENYVVYRDGVPLARISRLAQPSELEVVAGDIALNEHTTFRDFEDRMFDEFIWNRNRSLKKAWIDADYGWIVQNISDGKHADGNRFSITAGYDWQQTKTLILGLTARVAHMSSEDADSIDLSYKIGETVQGHNDISVSDTNVGVGAYLMKNLGGKARLYGNAFFDLHLFDITRHQTFVSDISGSASAFSLISEWGLMHDWLNQYIVGNLYARIGYNFGFSAKEDAANEEYLRAESDGYMILTPGYSLIAQKRIYPTSWFQIRPYASIGVEYDVLGMPDDVRFKFGPAHSYRNYGIHIDPLWANIGGGLEMLSANGIQIGLDYRYQYNNDIQLHKIRLSGSYRF